MPVMSPKQKSPIREGFGCHVKVLESMFKVMGSFMPNNGDKIGGRQNKGLKIVF